MNVYKLCHMTQVNFRFCDFQMLTLFQHKVFDFLCFNKFFNASGSESRNETSKLIHDGKYFVISTAMQTLMKCNFFHTKIVKLSLMFVAGSLVNFD